MLAKCRTLMASRKTVLLAVGCSCIAAMLALRNSAAAISEGEPDLVCEALLRDYVLNIGKIESRSVRAGTELLGIRGRGKDFWRVVLRHFKEADANGGGSTQSSRLLTVLTIMLEYDGQARWVLARPEVLRGSAWVPEIKLSNEVLDTIIQHAEAADRNQLDADVVAVIAGHDPRARKFLTSILRSDDGRVDAGTRFHAAVGLAELDDPAGFRWLIGANPEGEVWTAPHFDAPNGSCLESRIRALNDLIGIEKPTIEDWQAWWKSEGGRVTAQGRVRLRYP